MEQCSSEVLADCIPGIQQSGVDARSTIRPQTVILVHNRLTEPNDIDNNDHDAAQQRNIWQQTTKRSKQRYTIGKPRPLQYALKRL